MLFRLRWKIFTWLVVGLLLLLISPGSLGRASAQASGVTEDFPTDQIIVKYKSSSAAFASPDQPDQMTRLNQTSGLGLTYLRRLVGHANVLRLPSALPLERVQHIANLIASLPEVQYAEPDQRAFPVLSPNDTYYVAGDQSDLNDPTGGIDAPAAWDITTGSSSVVVADVDTGITTHADLVSRLVSGAAATSGYDFVSDTSIANDGNGRDSDPGDPGDWITSAESTTLGGTFYGCPVGNSSWHGTHTAGTIGALGNNALGVAGINWNSPLLIARVLGKCGGYFSDIIDGISWASGIHVDGVPDNTHPAKVINLSLGGTGSCSSSMQAAVTSVNNQGTVLVVAAGNSNANVSGFTPANCSGVVAVAATNRAGSRAYYSNYGSLVKISAPGGEQNYANDPNGILSTLNTGTTVPASDKYVYYQGTSMATPHVTGVVSLMFSVNPSLTPAQVLSLLQSTARAFPGGSNCSTSTCGAGILDAAAAVTAAQNLGTYYALTVTPAGSGSGTVTSNPPGINCGATCSHSFAANTSVILSASASVGSTFTGWSGSGCSGTGTCTVVMSSAQAVTATFDAAPNQTLTVTPAGTGSGTVSSNPPGINCGATCSFAFAYNTSVVLTATPTSPSTFGGWSGSGCSGTGTCTVSMTAARNVTATFNPPADKTLTVSKSGTGSGSIGSNPAGIDCGATCSFAFAYNTSVVLTATPTAPSTFGGWSGSGCSGTGTCTVLMTAAHSVTATFNPPPKQTLTVSRNGNGSGTVTSSPSGINCGSTCSHAYAYNTLVVLTATPAGSSQFTGWSGGGCSGTGTCSVTMTAASSVTATFKLKVHFDDFDGNGTTDLGIFRPSIGAWYVLNQFILGLGASGDIIVPGDYNGDGRTDPAVFRPSTGTWYVNGQAPAVWGQSGDIPVPGDYNGDGTTDIAVFRPSTGDWQILGQSTINWGTNGDIPVPGDYNGDGKTDLAVFRPSNGAWYVYNQFIIGWGTGGDIPVPGDYNGDGITDLAVFRPSNGAWYVYNQFIIGWGTGGDIPVPGDYNGDGLTDLAVFRPSNGAWYAYNQFIIGWGSSGDWPIPALDTNGDGDPYQ